MKKLFFWIAILVVIGGILYGLYYNAKRESEEDYGEFFELQGRDHIEVGATHDPYNSNPPSSGPHYGQPAQTGIYDKAFPDEQLVHNLEHSHVWIAYQPASASAEMIDRLAEIAKTYKSKVIMTPRVANDAPIALVAWQRVLKLQTLDENLINQFIRRYRGSAGPAEERLIPDFGFEDFRGK